MLRATSLILLFTLAPSLSPAQVKNPTPAPSIAALERQADTLFQQTNYTAAFDLYRQAANRGSAKSENKLGFMFGSGEGTRQDDTQAMYWCRKAAAQGYSPAELNLALTYLYGILSTPKDHALAARWFQAAAEQGDPTAQTGLGLLYLEGDGVTKNPAQARAWFQKAALQGFGEAKFHLAQMDGTVPTPTGQSITQPNPPPTAGTCAIVYEAETHDEEYGTHDFSGAAWSAPTLEGARAEAKSALLQQMNGEMIDTTVVGDGKGPGGGILLDASGCGFAHGAVVGTLKRDMSGNGYMANNVCNSFNAALASDIQAAIDDAMNQCRARFPGGASSPYIEDCKVTTQW